MNSHTVGIRNVTDFSPFGVELKGRNFEVVGGGNYRYAFQGQESDSEVKGEGNSYDFGARMLDPRLGRWMTLDPQSNKQPDQSPYKAFLNNPLYWADPNGETEYETIILVDEKTHQTTKLSVIKSDKIATDGKSIGKNLFGTKFYNYYSYSTVTKYTRAADGSISVKQYTDILYDHGVQRKNLGYGGKIIDPLDDNELAGGFYMTSGSGEGAQYSSKNADYVGNIDQLISLLGGANAKGFTKANSKISWEEGLELVGLLSEAPEKFDDLVKLYEMASGAKEDVKEENVGVQPINPNGEHQIESNTINWRNPKESRTNTGFRNSATEKEKIVGDTIGGNKDINIYPKKQ